MSNRLTPEQKRDAGMALNITELAKVTGWGVSSLRSMGLPLVCGKIRPVDFWSEVRKRMDAFESQASSLKPISLLAVASGLGAQSDPQKAADKFRAPRNSNGRKAASPCHAGSQPHSSE